MDRYQLIMAIVSIITAGVVILALIAWGIISTWRQS